MTRSTAAPSPTPDQESGFDALGVPAVLVQSLQRMGALVPTRVQREAIPPALTGADLAAVAATGTGKTLAYLLPMATRLLAEPPMRRRGKPTDPRRRLRALILCPTRELAQQVAREAAQLFRGTVLRAGAVYGKSALGPQRELVGSGIDLLAGTPGRVKELCELDALSLAFVRHVVLDEADRMLDLGFLPQAKEILSRAPEDRQLLLFTATMPRPVEAIVEELLRAPQRVDLVGRTPGRVEGTPAPRTEKGHHLIDVQDDDKAALTVALVKDGQRKGVIVFCRTRRRAGWVAAALRRHEIKTAVIHGDRSQRQRQEALASFAAGRCDVLVATDVAARGLHVPAVRTVVNYDVPLLPEEYVHRVGRAGHGGGSAEAITFRSIVDRDRWVQVERTTRMPLVAEAAPNFAAYGRIRVGFAPDAERLVGGRADGSHASIARMPPSTRRATNAPSSRRPGDAAADPRDAKAARKAGRHTDRVDGGRSGTSGGKRPAAKSGTARSKKRTGATGKAGATNNSRAAGASTPRRSEHDVGVPSAAALIRMGNSAAMRATGKKKKKRSAGAMLSMRGSDRARKIEKGHFPGGGVRRKER